MQNVKDEAVAQFVANTGYSRRCHPYLRLLKRCHALDERERVVFTLIQLPN